MSLRYLIAAFAARVGNPSRKLVLLKLADNANDDGICWPSAARVAHDTELSRDTVKRHLKGLESDRIIDVRRRIKDGVNLPSVYELIGLHAAAQGWGHRAPTRGDQNPGVGAESTQGRGIMHPEPFTESINEAAVRAPARTASDAAANSSEQKRKHPRRTTNQIECWYPSEDAPADNIEALFPAEQIATAVAAVKSRKNSVGKSTSPVPALVSVELDRIQQAAEAAGLRAREKAQRIAEENSIPPPEVLRQRADALAADWRTRINRGTA